MANKKTRIKRAQHGAQNHYFLMNRETAQNRDLSFEARGLLSYVLSKPDTWQIEIDDLKQKGCGRDKAYRILKELIDTRYVARIITRDAKKRIVEVDYIVHEEPLPEKPDTALPDTENQDSKENTEVDTTEKGSTSLVEEKKEVVSKPRPRDLIFDAVAEVSKLDPVAAGSFIAKAANLLRKARRTPEQVKRFGEIWYTREYPGGLKDRKPPSPATIAKYISWVDEREPDKETGERFNEYTHAFDFEEAA